MSDAPSTPGRPARPGAPSLAPGGAVLADLRLVAAGLLPPGAVLGEEPGGEGTATALRPDAGVLGAATAAGALVLTDEEGLPLARLDDVVADGDLARGRLVVLHPSLRADAAGAAAGGRSVLLRRPPTPADLDALRAGGTGLRLLVPTGSATPDGVPPALLEALAREAGATPPELVPLPLAWRGPAGDAALLRAVLPALGARDVVVLPAAGDDVGGLLPGAADGGAGSWPGTLAALRRGDADLPGAAPGAAALLRRRWPRAADRGLVVLLTGLSGSGKSTLARGLHARLERGGERTTSLLDGDVVRRLLSAGLGFDAAARDLNVRRIGFVAAEVARHGGVAVCAPIAPYARSRAAVRRMVEEVGDLVLVHVSTPLAVCEARDVKGLYARARAGELTGMTGVDDPYEVPDDADLVLDTSRVAEHEALDRLEDHLVAGGWLARPAPRG
ncbi:adenylyl-sulfate kinase [Pseudokineococcus lusitanus]|uniref:adenylyl-sulfate kinase n=1 Tax=Pseudokineococcus lusitanus TaxID=763993 RepID=A0A3N1HKL5_9ACTN|nr:adenylyl-sulfate kinase [Pseudokineococcus lusitanus]ROP43005.1 sulfate adenylyltransferase [Pseudokineococcus lusitanus]